VVKKVLANLVGKKVLEEKVDGFPPETGFELIPVEFLEI